MKQYQQGTEIESRLAHTKVGAINRLIAVALNRRFPEAHEFTKNNIQLTETRNLQSHHDT